MGIFPEGNGSGNVVYPPKVGEVKTFTINGPIERVENPGARGNYMKQGQVNQGYYDLLPVIDEDGNETKLKIQS